MARELCKCELCGKEDCEFVVTSKHVTYWVKGVPDYLKGNNSHIHKHICTECFLKIFDKGDKNGTGNK